jgi:subtilisin-like proprotein convertase family protein
VNRNDLVRYVKIFVDIDHSKLSDLEVSLSSPDATNVLLHNHTGGSNIINWYGYDNYQPPSEKLDTFKDKNPLGDWELNVLDINAGDAGELISYKLKIGFKTTFSENWFVYQ